MKQQTIHGRALCAGFFSLAMVATADAALLGRLPITPGGTDYQAFYDDTLDVTWLADANYAQTSGYAAANASDDQFSGTSTTIQSVGRMGWDAAMTWVDTLNTANYLGYDDWRLPKVLDTFSLGCNFSYGGTDCGYNVQTGRVGTTTMVYSEMASLWYDTLGNLAPKDTSGASQEGWGLSNTGPFRNFQPYVYWTGSEYKHPLGHTPAWYFDVTKGYQDYGSKDRIFNVLPVRSGDVSAVPVPAAVWLFGSGLIGLLGLTKRKL